MDKNTEEEILHIILHAIPPSNRVPGRVIPGNLPMKFYEGDHVIDHKGREAILITFDGKARPTVYGLQDNDFFCKGISPLCILFDDMPTGQAQPDYEAEDDDCELENFPRT